jgi:hypothetical protein
MTTRRLPARLPGFAFEFMEQVFAAARAAARFIKSLALLSDMIIIYA